MQVDSFESLAEAARALGAPGPAATGFFRSPDWFACLAGHGMAAATPLRVYLARDAAGPAAALFCRADPGRRTLESLTNFYSIDYGATPLRGPEVAREAVGAIARHIAAERPRWRKVTLRNVFGATEADDLAAAFCAAGLVVRTGAYNATWSVRIAGDDWPAYLGRRPSRLRNTLRRRGREAERRGARFSLHAAAEPEAVEAFMAVYAASWKKPEPHPDFIPALCRTAAAHGALRIGLLEDGGRAVAAQLWIVDGRRAVIYKLAHRDGTEALSPGTLLTGYMAERVAVAEGLDEISFGYGGEPYKGDWMEHCDPVVAVEASPRFSAGALRLVGAGLLRRLKRPHPALAG